MTYHPDKHADFTRTVFVDAIVGVGFPTASFATKAVEQGLALTTGDQQTWYRPALEELPLSSLQDLYMGIKTHGVNHYAS